MTSPIQEEQPKYPPRDNSGRLKINFPQADSDFDPSLFYPLEKYPNNNKIGMLDVKNALIVLYRTLYSLGYSVNDVPPDESELIFNWSGKHINYQTGGKTLIIEHGWLPRWSYQISDLGANARAHYAHSYQYSDLTGEEREYVTAYTAKMKKLYEMGINPEKVEKLKAQIKTPFILFPFQMSNDFNLKYSNTEFEEFYSTKLEGNITFSQACINYAEKGNPPLPIPFPILFKQHPMDKNTDIKQKLEISKDNLILENSDGVSTGELFATGLCKAVVSINSNTIHEALMWNIPSISIGTLLWSENTVKKPFPSKIENIGEDIGSIIDKNVLEDEVVLSYLFHVLKNQWFLSDFQNPYMVKTLVETCGRCEPYTLRKEYGFV